MKIFGVVGLVVAFGILFGAVMASSIVPVVTNNLNTNTISVALPVPSSVSLAYSGNDVISLDNVTITNATFSSTTHIILEAAGNFVVTAPSNDYPIHQTITLVNGEGVQEVNNVTINPPAAVSYKVSLNSSVNALNGTATPETNVSFKWSLGAEKVLTTNTIYLGYGQSFTSNSTCQTAICPVSVIAPPNESVRIIGNTSSVSGNYTLGPGDSFSYAKPNVVVEVLSGNSIVSSNDVGGATLNFNALSVSAIATNSVYVDRIFSYDAVGGCAPGGLVTVQNVWLHQNSTLCTSFLDANIPPLYALGISFDYYGGNYTRGLGQSWSQSFEDANTSSMWWKRQDAGDVLAHKMDNTTLWGLYNKSQDSLAVETAKYNGAESGINSALLVSGIVLILITAAGSIYLFNRKYIATSQNVVIDSGDADQ